MRHLMFVSALAFSACGQHVGLPPSVDRFEDCTGTCLHEPSGTIVIGQHGGGHAQTTGYALDAARAAGIRNVRFQGHAASAGTIWLGMAGLYGGNVCVTPDATLSFHGFRAWYGFGLPIGYDGIEDDHAFYASLMPGQIGDWFLAEAASQQIGMVTLRAPQVIEMGGPLVTACED